MLNSNSYETTPDLEPFANDVLAMQNEGVQQIIQKRGYTCSVSRDYPLLVGWLELLVIISKLVLSSVVTAVHVSRLHSVGSVVRRPIQRQASNNYFLSKTIEINLSTFVIIKVFWHLLLLNVV